MRRVVVIRPAQRQQAMGVVSPGCQDAGDCRGLHRRPVGNWSQGVMAIFATRLSAVCTLLHRLLGSVCARATASTTSGSRQGQWSDQPDRTLQLHLTPKSLATGTKNLVILKVVGQSHWCNLVLYPPLQRVPTHLGLPN